MRTPNNKETKRRMLLRYQELPVFWKHLLMMACVLFMAICALAINNYISIHSVQEKTLRDLQKEFEFNCSDLESSMYTTYAIPEAIEISKYYGYIRGQNAPVIPDKSVPVLPMITGALSNQLYLQGENVECMIYLPGINSICTSSMVFPVADDCFNEYICYSELSTEQILEYLKQKSHITLLPMQEVQIRQLHTKYCMTLIIRPINASVSVMTLYDQEYILNSFGMETMPEGSCLRLTDANGDVIMEYHKGENINVEDDGFELTGRLTAMRVKASLWIPRDYFKDMQKPAQLVGWMIILLTAIVGLSLCAVFSKASVQPILQLISAHTEDRSEEAEQSKNEIHYLGRLIENSRNQASMLRDRLAQTQLARALSGAILSEDELNILREGIGLNDGAFRVAILSSKPEVNSILSNCLPCDYLTDEFRFHTINHTESGLFFADSCENMQILETGMKKLRADLEAEGQKVCCGVSTAVEELNSFHVAVRQARIAVQKENGYAVFSGDRLVQKTIPWMQHERLYQSILANDEDGTIQLLHNLSEVPKANSEAFYSVRMVIRSAAEEIDQPFEEREIVHYDTMRQPGENISRLENMIRQMFSRTRGKQNQSKATRQEQILEYIQENYWDYSLCASSCGAVFGISEKRIYAAVRDLEGVSFSEYLLSLRMEKAGKMLCSTQETVANIAEKCGYQAVNTFYRVFKKFYGIAPVEYRKCDGHPHNVENLDSEDSTE